MSPLIKWFDSISIYMLLIPAVFLGIAPLVPEPHLIEKLRMLSEGMLSRPIDILDLLMHSIFIILVLIKLIRMVLKKQANIKE